VAGGLDGSRPADPRFYLYLQRTIGYLPRRIVTCIHGEAGIGICCGDDSKSDYARCGVSFWTLQEAAVIPRLQERVKRSVQETGSLQ
jgi:hypothetical protein